MRSAADGEPASDSSKAEIAFMKAGQYSCSNRNCEVTANLIQMVRIHHKRGSDMRNGKKLWKGVVSGAVAGLVASWTMNQFQSGVSKLQKPQSTGSQPGEGEDATMKAANLGAEKILDRELSTEEKKKTAPFLHYGFGTLMGAIYGAVAEEFPAATSGFGTAYATGVFLVADEGAVPALGLGPRPKEISLSKHAYALASHLVYGLSTESVRRGVRAALGRDTWKSRAREFLKSNAKTMKSSAKTLKSKVNKAKDAIVHWEVEQRTELPKKVSSMTKAARKKWQAAA